MPMSACEIDDDSRLALVGRSLPAADQRLLKAYAAHASVLGERRRAAAESGERRALEETDRTRTALLAAVSHDLRSPLAAVKAAISSLRNTDIDWSPEDEEALLATVEESADRLDDLVANLLDMSRLQMGAVKAHVDEVEVEGVVRGAIAALAGRERVDVSVDRRRLRLSWLTAACSSAWWPTSSANALSYAPAGTRARVDASASATGRVDPGRRLRARRAGGDSAIACSSRSSGSATCRAARASASGSPSLAD